MPRTSNTLPPEIASKLADVARELREHIYGEQACPKWGTRFTEIEDQGMQVGLELARMFMQQSVQHQADGEIQSQAVDCDGEQAVIDKNRQHETTLDTPAGEVEWKQTTEDSTEEIPSRFFSLRPRHWDLMLTKRFPRLCSKKCHTSERC